MKAVKKEKKPEGKRFVINSHGKTNGDNSDDEVIKIAKAPAVQVAQPVKKYFRRDDGCIIRKIDGAVVKLADGTLVRNPKPDPNFAPPIRAKKAISKMTRISVKQEVRVKKERGSRRSPTKKSTKSSADMEGDSSEADAENAAAQVRLSARKATRPTKESLIADILCRWWYCMPDWPPANHDYTDVMKKAGIRLVSAETFDAAPEKQKGLKKAYELSTFPGKFRDYEEKLYDLRPKDSCPCFKNLVQKSESELWGMLETALTKQLKEIEKSSFYNIVEFDVIRLRKRLEEARAQARK